MSPVMTDDEIRAQCESILNAVVTSFIKRHRKLWARAETECLIYGRVLPETSAKMKRTMEYEPYALD